MRLAAVFSSELLGPEGAAQLSWSPDGNLLAAAALRRKKVVLFDRDGDVVASVTVPDPAAEFLYAEETLPPVVALAWHPASTHLAVLPRGQSFAVVWTAAGGTARVDSGLKAEEVSALAWSPAGTPPRLALGTARGGGVVHDLTTRAATPLGLGRGAKPVVCMAWSAAGGLGGALALGCKGGALLLCRAVDGSLVRSIQLRGAISQLQCCADDAGSSSSQPPSSSSSSGGSLLAANVGKRTVCIWQLPQALADGSGSSGGGGAAASGAFELSFRDSYGEVEAFCWAHPRLLVAGFSSGQVVALSLSGSLQPGAGARTELFSARCLQRPVVGLCWSAAAGTLAAGSGAQLAVLLCRDGAVELEHGEAVEAPGMEGDGRMAALDVTSDGQLLTVVTAGGRLLTMLARPPMLHGSWRTRLAYLDPIASRAHAQLLDAAAGAAAAPVALPLPPCDPTQLAVWFQAVEPSPATGLLPPPTEAEFPVAIRALHLGADCVLLLGEGGRVFVQEPPRVAAGRPGGALAGGGEVAAVELQGEDGAPFAASCAALTEHFILLGLPDGTLAFYQASDCLLASEYAHAAGIQALFPSADGAMVLFRDAAGAAFLYDATHGELMALPDFAGELSAAAWDAADPRVLAAVSSAGAVHVYCLIPASVQGPGLKLVGTQAAPAAGAVPLALCAGVLTWHLREGPLHSQLLATHQHLAGRPASKPASRTASGKAALHAAAAAAVAAEAALAMSREERLEARCQQALALCHFERALEAASQLGDAELLRQVAASALQFLELPVAIAAYEAAGDAAALAQLRPLLGVEDEQLLAGHIVAITGGDADRAEQLLLASSQPGAAIDMRAGLGHWERAVELAEHLEPHAVGHLALLNAQAAEAEGQTEAALAAYQRALSAPDLTLSSGVPGAAERRATCQAGVARCCILAGDAERGVELALADGSEALLLQCARLLEREQLPKLAGQLCARAGQHERAARLFLACREFGLLDGVMAHAGRPQLWLEYAQAKEDLGSFTEAARAYEQAGDAATAVRVLLERLHDADAAAELAARAGSAEASLAVARACERSGRHQLAVEQYCAGGDCAAAFALASRTGLMPAFAAWASAARDAPAALLAAGHFEAAGQLAAAGELCALAGKHERAARLYIQAGGDSLPAAIKMAGECGDPAAAAVVLEHLQAVDAAGPALLELHLALGNAEQACAVAAARARQEQESGNYKAARDQLLHMCLEMQRRGAAATPALLSALHLVHAYLLVRVLVRQGDHPAAARLLLVVAAGIAAFPKHAAAILTSTVIECHRAGLHGAAQRWASALMAPQYAAQVAPAYAKKIEAIAKQPAWTAEAQAEAQADCLFCGAAGPEAALDCAACQRRLPFCAASGRRMALNDWSACPTCNFPCRGRDLTRYASQERCCPLCEAPVAVHDVKRVFDPVSHLRKTAFAGLMAGSRKDG